MTETSSIAIDGGEFVLSRDAAKITGYAQDYIGQLARSGQIEAKRIGGLWYVSMPSLIAYKQKADQFVPQPPQVVRKNDPESLIAFDGKDYVSAARAAELSGYHQDYVGQLAREGSILARQVGSRWYVERENILRHKREKDALLAAVQAESVGLQKATKQPENLTIPSQSASSFYRYSSDNADLMPKFSDPVVVQEESKPAEIPTPIVSKAVPIRVLRAPSPVTAVMPTLPRKHGQNTNRHAITAAVITVVLVLAVGGFFTLKNSSIYASASPGVAAMGATAGNVADLIGSFLEMIVAREIVYKRN